MPNLGTPELLIILFIILLLFGAKKLTRTVGTSVKELRSSLSDDKKDDSKPNHQG